MGFKHLAPLLENKKVSFAGEESGGYSIGNHLADKDGIFSALLYLENLSKSNKNQVNSLIKSIQNYPKKSLKELIKTFQPKIENLSNKRFIN